MFPIYLGTNDLHRRFYFLYHDGGTHCPKGSLQMCPGSLQCSSMRHCRRGGVQCPCLVQMYPALHSMFVLHFGMHFPINFPFPLTLMCTSQTYPGLLLQSSPKVHSDSGSYQFGLPGPKIMLSKARKDTINFNFSPFAKYDSAGGGGTHSPEDFLQMCPGPLGPNLLKPGRGSWNLQCPSM